MKYKTKLSTLLLALLMTLSFAGCLVPEETQAPDAAPQDTQPTAAADVPSFDPEAVAAELGTIEITAEDLDNVFDSYIQMFDYSGSLDEDMIVQCRDMSLQYLVEYYTPLWKADQLGVKLTAEEEAEIETETSAQLDEERDALICQFAYYAGATEEYVEDVAQLTEEQKEASLAMIDEQLAVVFREGFTFDQYLLYERGNIATELRIERLSDKLRAESEKDFAMTDEQVEAWYADTFAAQQESFDSDPEAYLDQVEAYAAGETKYPALYVPEGVLRVQIIRIAPENDRDIKIDTNRAEMSALEQEYGKLALNGENEERLQEIVTEYATLKAENDALEEAYSGEARKNINKAYEALEEGTPFEDVMQQYNANGSTAETLILKEDDSVYGELSGFAAELLPGTYSEPIPVDDVYYIVRLIETLPAGAVDRAAIADAIRTAASEDASEETWDALMEEWITEAQAAVVRHEDVIATVGRDYLVY